MSGTHQLNLAEEAFQMVRRQIPKDQVPAWDELAKGQPLGKIIRLAKLWRVTLTDAARPSWTPERAERVLERIKGAM